MSLCIGAYPTEQGFFFFFFYRVWCQVIISRSFKMKIQVCIYQSKRGEENINNNNKARFTVNFVGITHFTYNVNSQYHYRFFSQLLIIALAQFHPNDCGNFSWYSNRSRQQHPKIKRTYLCLWVKKTNFPIRMIRFPTGPSVSNIRNKNKPSVEYSRHFTELSFKRMVKEQLGES